MEWEVEYLTERELEKRGFSNSIEWIEIHSDRPNNYFELSQYKDKTKTKENKGYDYSLIVWGEGEKVAREIYHEYKSILTIDRDIYIGSDLNEFMEFAEKIKVGVLANEHEKGSYVKEIK